MFFILIICLNSNAQKIASLDDFIKLKEPDEQIDYLESFTDSKFLSYQTFLSFYPIIENSKNERVLFYWHYKHITNIWYEYIPFEQLDYETNKMIELSDKIGLSVEKGVALFYQSIFKYSYKLISEQNLYYNYLQCFHLLKNKDISNYKRYGIDAMTTEIGRNFYDVGDYENALDCLLLGYYQMLEKSKFKNINLNLIESIYAEKKDFLNARKYAQLSLKFNKNLENSDSSSIEYHKYWQCLLGFNLAYYNLMLGDTIKCRVNLNEAFNKYIPNLDYKNYVKVTAEFDVLQKLVRNKQLLGEISETGKYLKRALFLKDLLDIDYQRDRFRPIELYKRLSIYYNFNKEYDKAYKYLILSNELQDSLNLVNDKRKIWQVESRLKAEEFEDAVTKIESDNLNQNKIKNTVLFIIVLVLLVLVLVFFNIRKKNIVIVKQKDELEKSLKEKELLFREVHHRVKNNLQIVSSLLLREIRKNSNPLFKSLMSDAHARIDSMALVYDNLYQNREISSINMKSYIKELVINSKIINKRDDLDVEIRSEIDKINLNINTAGSLGLIITELIINIYKHAFIERNKGEVIIKLKLIDNLVKLELIDNGVGFNTIEVNSRNEKSTGLLLINGLVRQLDGKHWFEPKSNGTHFVLEFQLQATKPILD
ncbi:MAG: sensor histidine kinase [Bacteroidia bacterium]